jgi:hypothetical protein
MLPKPPPAVPLERARTGQPGQEQQRRSRHLEKTFDFFERSFYGAGMRWDSLLLDETTAETPVTPDCQDRLRSSAPASSRDFRTHHV